MSGEILKHSPLRHRHVEVENLSLHVVEGGSVGSPTVLFLHGWPESWATFERVMIPLSREARVVAIDLPGIGASTTPPPSGDKRSLARVVHALIESLELKSVTLVGQDVGGQIVYAFLKAYPERLERAVIANVAVPGVEPWSEVKANPYIWHFGFHAVPELPERMVAGREEPYFAYFYDRLSVTPAGVDAQARAIYVEAYSRPSALRTGFEWYRAFPQDERDNLAAQGQRVTTPVLYLRGDKDFGNGMEKYLEGFRASGLSAIQGRVIPNCGHFATTEQPGEVLSALREFMGMDEAAPSQLEPAPNPT